MLASNGLYEGYCWRRERDSFSAHTRTVSNLLISEGAQATDRDESDQGPHVGHTAGGAR